MKTILTSIAVLMIITACKSGGTFKDTRNGQKYKYVKIGKQVWMAENMNYKTGNSWCLYDWPGNCEKYGRLYDWETALKACPTGWRLPNDKEWTQLTDYLGQDAFMKMGSTTGWYEDENGTNESGFNGLPGGIRYFSGNFGGRGYVGNWWTNSWIGDNNVWARRLMYLSTDLYRDSSNMKNGLSVRCVRW